MINNFLYVAIGGAFGAVLRYAFSLIKINGNIPWTTLLVNIIGSFIVGICLTLFKNNKLDQSIYLLLATGICGGFTTFSTFSAESLSLLQQDKIVWFAIYILLSITLGLVATYLGYKLVK